MLGIPLYKQIINDILEKIFNGTLRPGDRIPSEHELSTSYMVSSITSNWQIRVILSGKRERVPL